MEHFGALKAKYNINFAPGKVGILMPAFSHEICWFAGVLSIQSAIDLVLAQNWFIDANRLSFRVNGNPASIASVIRPGDIIEIDGTLAHPYHRRKLDRVIEKRRRELEPSSSDDEGPIFSSDEEGMRGPTPPNSDGADGPWRAPTYTPAQYRKIKREEAKKNGPPTSPTSLEIYLTPTKDELLKPRTDRPPLNFADRVGPKVSELTKSEKRQVLKRAPKFPHRKVTLRFHLVDFGEKPIELWATNYEPLHIHFNILRRRLLRNKTIDDGDELNFVWPHLRWIPCGNTRVHSIRTDPKINTYACFVSKRGTEIGNPGKDDDNGQGSEAKEPEEKSSSESEEPDTPAPKYQQVIELREWDPPNPNQDGENSKAIERSSSLWDTGRDTTPAKSTDLGYDVQSQSDLIAFSRPGSPCHRTEADSVSELSTVSHESTAHNDKDDRKGSKFVFPTW
ncbi:hypothetical protein TWF506_004008 [Arthrobotrys conoides]|uniref:Uncharacterized protein n=1 Tax=Arthrobotrys conoides TaxID=74498 RepID=A0AAN8MXB0_9PEZI